MRAEIDRRFELVARELYGLDEEQLKDCTDVEIGVSPYKDSSFSLSCASFSSY